MYRSSCWNKGFPRVSDVWVEILCSTVVEYSGKREMLANFCYCSTCVRKSQCSDTWTVTLAFHVRVSNPPVGWPEYKSEHRFWLAEPSIFNLWTTFLPTWFMYADQITSVSRHSKTRICDGTVYCLSEFWTVKVWIRLAVLAKYKRYFWPIPRENSACVQGYQQKLHSAVGKQLLRWLQVKTDFSNQSFLQSCQGTWCTW